MVRLASPESQAKNLRAQARSKASRGEWEDALKSYVQSIAAFREKGEDNEVAFTLAEVAEGLAQRNKPQHAAAFFDQAIAAAAKTNDPAYLAPILRDAGLFFRTNGEKERAHEMLRDSYDLFEILKDEWAQAMLSQELGRITGDLGKPDEALEWFRRALALAPEERDADLRMRIYFEMGRTFDRKGLRERAAAAFHHSASIAKKIFDVDTLIASLEELGNLAMEEGHLANAKRYMKEAYAMNAGLLTTRRPGDTPDEADEAFEKRKDALVSRLISAYLADPNAAVSEREIAEFLAHLHKRRDSAGLASALERIAEYFRVRGEHARAARFFENASGIFERAGMSYVAAEIGQILGDLYRDRGLPRKAFNRYWKGAHLMEGDTQKEHASLKRRLQERMEALKPALAQAHAAGDDGMAAAGTMGNQR